MRKEAGEGEKAERGVARPWTVVVWRVAVGGGGLCVCARAALVVACCCSLPQCEG